MYSLHLVKSHNGLFGIGHMHYVVHASQPFLALYAPGQASG